jgi:hypothetical protein
MNSLQQFVATSEILALFVLCLGTSLGIAYLLLKMVIAMTTHVDRENFKPVGTTSRRWLGAQFVRASHDPRT